MLFFKLAVLAELLWFCRRKGEARFLARQTALYNGYKGPLLFQTVW